MILGSLVCRACLNQGTQAEFPHPTLQSLKPRSPQARNPVVPGIGIDSEVSKEMQKILPLGFRFMCPLPHYLLQSNDSNNSNSNSSQEEEDNDDENKNRKKTKKKHVQRRSKQHKQGPAC